ncbi:MAG: DUF1501 domain-containing protein [Gemmatimonadaceae bacterium]
MARALGFIAENRDDPRALVIVFLRGGADGLSLVPPVGDDDYHRARPRLRIAQREAVRLDDPFALHPRLQSLHRYYAAGRLTVVHGAGSEDATRSHFEAQDLMEHGGFVAGGWLGRFLRMRDAGSGASLGAVALGGELPEALRGAPSAIMLRSLDDLSLTHVTAHWMAALERLYSGDDGVMRYAGGNTFTMLRRLQGLAAPRAAAYPGDGFGRALSQIAALIKARVGLDAACVDLGGWDSHFSQQTLMDPLITRLGDGLAAFAQDLGPALDSTTIIVMTEFGRRVAENASFGTDHGRGSVMFLLGGGVHGGRVLSGWRGLGTDVLEGPGDVPVTTNYRDVLAPILARHGAAQALGRIFPAFELRPASVYG